VVRVDLGPAPFLELLFGLVADGRATGGAHGTTDDRAGRPTDGAADGGTCSGATERASTGSGLVIGALRGLAGHGATDGADRAAHDRARGSTDSSTEGGATERAGTGAHGLTADLLIIDRIPAVHRAIEALSVDIRIEGISVGIDPTCVVRSVHLGASWVCCVGAG
jgi:hypothetical protein